MKSYKIIFISLFFLMLSAPLCLSEDFIASEETMRLLKKDLVSKKLKVGKARLFEIRKYYGVAPQISVDAKKVVYDYDELRVEFHKKKILIRWEYDTFKDPVYTSDVDKLRKDLESEEIAGNNITYNYIVKEYGEPTELLEVEEDGKHSIYYYGDIKLTFENVKTLRKYRIKGLSNI